MAAAEAEHVAPRHAAFSQQCPAHGTGVGALEVRMSQTRSSYEPTRLTAGQAATIAPTGPCDQPWAMIAVRVAAMPARAASGPRMVSAPCWRRTGGRRSWPAPVGQ